MARLAPSDLTTPGRFVIGCNYWASHAGTRMWSDWRPDVVDRDLTALAAAGLQVLRVFPLWPDFQPLHLLRGGGGQPYEFRHGEEPLADDAAGLAGVSPVAMARFAEFLDLAEKHGLGLVVGLLTGWMSGRFYAPPALESLNVLTDPVALQWELRFVRHFVAAFRDRAPILGWDLGNECNCLGHATREQAATWTATIASAIRAEDRTRPVVSGLHGLTPAGTWTMQDQGEWTDLLTTHPYPVFTPHCDQDPVNTLRTHLHGTAESRFYADIGGRPCLCQEIGTLGPVIASEAVAADFIRTSLFSLWANDCHGLLWWCAHDQDHLRHPPYDWCAVERELGLLRQDGSAKPVLGALSAFRRLLDALPWQRLPPRRTEAVCILTSDQDTWGVAYSTFILAKQAGFDLEFRYESQPLPEAPLYLLPSLNGLRMVPRRRLDALLERVAAGATLYLSLDAALPSGFEPMTGLEPQTRERRREFGSLTLDGLAGAPAVPACGTHKVRLRATRATVLGREGDGNPAFAVVPYGRGKVYALMVPMEMHLTRTPGAFHAPDAPPCHRVYQEIAREARAGRVVCRENPFLAVTEHALSATARAVVVINHGAGPVRERLALAAGWRLGRAFHGSVTAAGAGAVAVEIAAGDAVVFEVVG